MISDLNKNNLDAFVGQGGWVGDIASKTKNLVRLYESKEMPTEALIHMLTEMMKITSATATAEEILRKDDLNGVTEAILEDAKAAWA
jgi:hypothetical protein